LSYTSPINGTKVGIELYIAQLVCLRKPPITERNIKFQEQFARQLLKLYSGTAIIRALKSKELERCFSLNAKWVDPVIQRENDRWLKEQKLLNSPLDILSPEVLDLKETRPSFVGKKGGLSNLD
jgi:hypothetical protein